MPINGTTSAAAALRYLERKQEVISNNLANANTAGFKAERVFARLLGNAMPVAQTSTNLRVGDIEDTASPLDLAIWDKGFLVVSTPTGERWSRGGSLRIDEKDRLVTTDGHPLLGVKGPVILDSSLPVEISRDGEVSQDGVVVDVLRMEAPKDGESLQHEGSALFIPGATRDNVRPDERTLDQAHIEGSNADTTSAMVDMIGVLRAYGAVQKAIVEMDKIHQTAVSQLARPS